MKKYILSNIKLSPDDDSEALANIASKKLRINKSEIKNIKILKESIDARKKADIKLIYSILVDVDDRVTVKLSGDITPYKKIFEPKEEINGQRKKLEARPIVVGTGPAGLFAAYTLAKAGYSPIVIERGNGLEKRVKKVDDFWKRSIFDSETNVQFGEGGAGTFSDGKLTTRISDEYCDSVLELFVKLGALPEIKYKAKPHIGSDKLRSIIINMRKEIETLGGEILFDTKFSNIITKNGKLDAIELNGNEIIKTNVAILALGHSARDTFEMLLKQGVLISPKAFSVGMRIEHLQEDIDEARYGSFAGHPKLGHADYALFEKLPDRTVYTFCMCPGGTVVAAGSEPNSIVTNGMSMYKRDGKNSNSALVVSVSPGDFGKNPFDGIEFQRKLEKAAYAISGDYSAPIQRLEDFLNNTPSKKIGRIEPSYTGNTCLANLCEVLPNYVTDAIRLGVPLLEKRLRGFATSDAILTGVETRTSSPIRINRGDNFESISLEGLFPAGEGAGYAGGIISAAVDGIRSAKALIKRYANF